MISAAEARVKLSGSEELFEKNANAIADYLIDHHASNAIEKMIATRSAKYTAEYSLDEAYRPAFKKIGLGHLVSRMEDDEWNRLTRRARKIANDRLKELGYKGAGFYDASRGEPFYGGGSGVYYVTVLELEI